MAAWLSDGFGMMVFVALLLYPLFKSKKWLHGASNEVDPGLHGETAPDRESNLRVDTIEVDEASDVFNFALISCGLRTSKI